MATPGTPSRRSRRLAGLDSGVKFNPMADKLSPPPATGPNKALARLQEDVIIENRSFLTTVEGFVPSFSRMDPPSQPPSVAEPQSVGRPAPPILVDPPCPTDQMCVRGAGVVAAATALIFVRGASQTAAVGTTVSMVDQSFEMTAGLNGFMEAHSALTTGVLALHAVLLLGSAGLLLLQAAASNRTALSILLYLASQVICNCLFVSGLPTADLAPGVPHRLVQLFAMEDPILMAAHLAIPVLAAIECSRSGQGFSGLLAGFVASQALLLTILRVQYSFQTVMAISLAFTADGLSAMCAPFVVACSPWHWESSVDSGFLFGLCVAFGAVAAVAVFG